MKVTNLILHILTSLALFTLQTVPLGIGFVGSAISLFFYSDRRLDRDVAGREFGIMFFSVVGSLLALLLMIFCIVAFVKKKKRKSYIIWEGVTNGLAFMGVLFCFLSAWNLDQLLGDFTPLVEATILPLLMTIVTAILWVIVALTSGPEPKNPAPTNYYPGPGM